MEHIFNRDTNVTLKDLKYALKKFRGLLSKILKSMENENTVKVAKDRTGLAECAQAVRQMQDAARTLSLFVETPWYDTHGNPEIVNPNHGDVYHVMDIPDILNNHMTRTICSQFHCDADAAWNILKEWLKDKILGFSDVGVGLAVFSEDRNSTSLTDAFEHVKYGKR